MSRSDFSVNAIEQVVRDVVRLLMRWRDLKVADAINDTARELELTRWQVKAIYYRELCRARDEGRITLTLRFAKKVNLLYASAILDLEIKRLVAKCQYGSDDSNSSVSISFSGSGSLSCGYGGPERRRGERRCA